MGRLEIVIISKEERDFLVLQSLSFIYTKLIDKGSRPPVPHPTPPHPLKKKGKSYCRFYPTCYDTFKFLLF